MDQELIIKLLQPFYWRHYSSSMKDRVISNDSLVFSQCVQQDINLLSQEDDTIWTQSSYVTKIKNHQPPMKIQKPFSFLNQSMQSNDSFVNYLNKVSETDKATTVKSSKKLSKDKQQFLSLNSKIQNISLKPSTRAEKINQLVSLIQTQKINSHEKKLRQFMAQLIEVADDVISQKKSLQRQLQNIIQMNKLMSAKLKQVEKQLAEAKLQKLPTSGCRCQRTFSFTKNSQSPVSYLQRFQFAKTIISSMEQLQLKKIQQQEGFSINQMPLVQLLWILKNKAQGSMINISHGLLDRISTGSTLKQWIKKIDEKVTCVPKISMFQINEPKHLQLSSQNIMKDFITILNQNSHQFIKNIGKSENPKRQLQIVKYSTVATFTQILMEQKEKMSKQQALAHYGNMNRYLKLIEKKSGILAEEEQIFNMHDIGEIIQSIC